MNSDNGFDDEYDDAMAYDDSDFTHKIEGDERSSRVDPLDITDPKSAYFFLSDDAQEEIEATGKRRMRCVSCGHKFLGEICDRCPECFSPNIEEIIL